MTEYNTQAYKEVVEYHFEVMGEVIAITNFYDGFAEVEEVRKNGQEDTHMSGVMYTNDKTGEWEWEAGRSKTLFAYYHSYELEDAILGYIQEHGLPTK